MEVLALPQLDSGNCSPKQLLHDKKKSALTVSSPVVELQNKKSALSSEPLVELSAALELQNQNSALTVSSPVVELPSLLRRTKRQQVLSLESSRCRKQVLVVQT